MQKTRAGCCSGSYTACARSPAPMNMSGLSTSRPPYTWPLHKQAQALSGSACLQGVKGCNAPAQKQGCSKDRGWAVRSNTKFGDSRNDSSASAVQVLQPRSHERATKSHKTACKELASLATNTLRVAQRSNLLVKKFCQRSRVTCPPDLPFASMPRTLHGARAFQI